MIDALIAWQRRAIDRAQLEQLDDRLLRDIGLTREMVDRDVDRPVWRV